VRLRRSVVTGPGFTRVRRGKGFSYLDVDGEPLTDEKHLDRIKDLVVEGEIIDRNEVDACIALYLPVRATQRRTRPVQILFPYFATPVGLACLF